MTMKTHPDRVVVWIIGPGVVNPCTILVIEEDRSDCRWKAPSGKIEYLPELGRFETPAEAAMRELEQETGLRVRLTQGNLIESRYKASHGYTIHNFAAQSNFKQLRRQGRTGERTIRYPFRRLPYPLDGNLLPWEKPLLRGRTILSDDLNFLKRVRRAEVVSPLGFVYRYEPGYALA